MRKTKKNGKIEKKRKIIKKRIDKNRTLPQGKALKKLLSSMLPITYEMKKKVSRENEARRRSAMPLQQVEKERRLNRESMKVDRA